MYEEHVAALNAAIGTAIYIFRASLSLSLLPCFCETFILLHSSSFFVLPDTVTDSFLFACRDAITSEELWLSGSVPLTCYQQLEAKP